MKTPALGFFSEPVFWCSGGLAHPCLYQFFILILRVDIMAIVLKIGCGLQGPITAFLDTVNKVLLDQGLCFFGGHCTILLKNMLRNDTCEL